MRFFGQKNYDVEKYNEKYEKGTFFSAKKFFFLKDFFKNSESGSHASGGRPSCFLEKCVFFKFSKKFFFH